MTHAFSTDYIEKFHQHELHIPVMISSPSGEVLIQLMITIINPSFISHALQLITTFML